MYETPYQVCGVFFIKHFDFIIFSVFLVDLKYLFICHSKTDRITDGAPVQEIDTLKT